MNSAQELHEIGEAKVSDLGAFGIFGMVEAGFYCFLLNNHEIKLIRMILNKKRNLEDICIDFTNLFYFIKIDQKKTGKNQS